MVLAFKDPPRGTKETMSMHGKNCQPSERTASSWSVRRRVSDSNNFNIRKLQVERQQSNEDLRQLKAKFGEILRFGWNRSSFRVFAGHMLLNFLPVHSLSWVPYGSASQTSVCTQILCLLKMRVLPQEVWSGTQGSAFPQPARCAGAKLIPGPHSSSQGFVLSLWFRTRTLKLKNW